MINWIDFFQELAEQGNQEVVDATAEEIAVLEANIKFTMISLK